MPRSCVDVGSVGSAFTSPGGLNSLGVRGLLKGFYAFGVLDGWLRKGPAGLLPLSRGADVYSKKKSLLRSHFDSGLRCRAPKSRLSTCLCFDSWGGVRGNGDLEKWWVP